MPNEPGSANPFAIELTGAAVDEESTTDLSKIGETEEEVNQADAAPEAYVPKRLRGKPIEDIYKEFDGLEKDYSRMGNELGEARSLLRETLEKALTANRVVEPELTDDDFTLEPKKAVQKMIENALKPVKDATVSAEQRAIMSEFNIRHPNYQQTAQSPEFKEWVGESAYRTRMFNAASRFDMDAAEDLFSAFATAKASGETAVSNDKRAEIRRASTETGSAGKSTSKTGKKIYKSTDLMRLFNTNREQYNDMSKEIQQAFLEGRVR